jgi:hypothetical protein
LNHSSKAIQLESHNCIIIGTSFLFLTVLSFSLFALHSSYFVFPLFVLRFVLSCFALLLTVFKSQLMSPDGAILCKCDLKKINWYLDRNLGEIVAQDPLTLKFNVSRMVIVSFSFFSLLAKEQFQHLDLIGGD